MNAITKIITPEEFKGIFGTCVKVVEQQIINAKYTGDGLTRIFLGPAGVLEQVAARLELTPLKEKYYKIDFIMFQEKDAEHFSENYVNAKVLNIVVEHEIQWLTSTQEMNKLTMLNSPLRVLIAYPNNEIEEGALIARFEEILRYSDWANDISTSRRVLIIFGWIGDGDKTDWEYFTYKDGRLIQI